MNLLFNGLRRRVTEHNHEVKRMENPEWKRRRVRVGERAEFQDVVSMRGNIYTVGLTGDFRMEVIITKEEIEKVVENRVQSDPVECIEWLGRLHAKAVAEAIKRASGEAGAG